MAKKKSKHYVDSDELEAHWANWLDTKCPASYEFLMTSVYKICRGVAVHFKPPNEDELDELAHQAFSEMAQKIVDGRLTYEPGRAPVFNLLTTTAWRQLCSRMTKRKRHREILQKHRQNFLSEHPEYRAVPGKRFNKSD